MRFQVLGAAVAGAALLLTATGCGSVASKPSAAASSSGGASNAPSSASTAASASSSTESSSTTPAATTNPTGNLTVLAAASLTGTFTKIGKDFETANPAIHVTFSFGASSTLAQQIIQGAPADVFASAAPSNMKQVADAGDVSGTAATFVRNQLVIAVPKGNPEHITGLADLTRPGVKVVECAAQVPCGAAAAKALAAANVKLTPVSLEADVKSTLAKLTLGEADAALVYRTDALSVADKADGVEFPESAQAINDYPIAVLSHTSNSTAAQAFVAFVQSAPEMSVLTAAGFQKP
ncbi:MAG: molybdate ABC transporter substrate-binding protein [Catenulispora sp.]|nr:molybdate ABC transporter substrate-binding protein [Catenulispora sp.]